MGSKDSAPGSDPSYNYTYTAWKFYGTNDAPGASITKSAVLSWTNPVMDDAQYKHIDWKVEMEKPARWAPEVYGYYLKTANHM